MCHQHNLSPSLSLWVSFSAIPPFSLIDSFLHLPSSQLWITRYLEPGCQRSRGRGGEAREFTHTTLIHDSSLSLTDVQKWNPRYGTNRFRGIGGLLGEGRLRKEWEAEFHLSLKYFVSFKN